ncbi:hypothetical protein AYI69_g6180 [Smittium culicis]|uniref:Uncharacterized protein n=1 Tax=Smittium culicis TaxID=133412 RepID=A0A1R1Y125_9FUNG|nr:hypothetical protein AYI69_g6180 [Smittium culicis]
MPHIDEDFYKSIGSEEETKEVIKACPRSSTMNYSPPSLNENIMSAVKKTDTTLYGIHIVLAQATRPLHNFVYRKYKEDSKAAKEDERVSLESAMRLILAKLLDKAISMIKTVKNARLRKSFQIRQQYGPYRSPPSSTTTAQTIQSGQTSNNPTYTPEFLNRVSENGRERGRGIHRFPSEPPSWGRLTMFKKAWVHDSIHGPETAPTTDNSSSLVQEVVESGSQSGTDGGNNLPIIQESNRGGRSIKPGALQPTLLYPQEDRVAKSSLGFKKPEQVCSGKELQDRVSQLYLHVNQKEGLHDVLKSERRLPPHPGPQSLIKGTMLAVYHGGPEQAHETWSPGKFRHVGDSADTNDKSPVNDHKLPRDDSQGAKGESPGPPPRSSKNTKCRAENAQGTGELHWKSSSYVCGSASRSSHAEATSRAQELLSQDNDFMEIDGPVDEISGPKPSILERPVGQMEWPVLPPRETRDRGLHRCQRHGMGGSFRLQFLLWVIESITGVDAYQLQGTIDNIETFTILNRKYSPHDEDMFASKVNKNVAPYYSWFQDKKAIDDPEGEKRTFNNKISNTVVGISNLVLRSTENVSAATHNTTSNRISSLSCKRKVPDDLQQELVPYGMENQQSIFEAQGISNSAIDIIMKK